MDGSSSNMDDKDALFSPGTPLTLEPLTLSLFGRSASINSAADPLTPSDSFTLASSSSGASSNGFDPFKGSVAQYFGLQSPSRDFNGNGSNGQSEPSHVLSASLSDLVLDSHSQPVSRSGSISSLLSATSPAIVTLSAGSSPSPSPIPARRDPTSVQQALHASHSFSSLSPSNPQLQYGLSQSLGLFSQSTPSTPSNSALIASSSSPSASASPVNAAQKILVIVFSGLPGRGKSYLSRRIKIYLSWLGFSTKIFNAGQYRREKYGPSSDASFFDPNDPNATKIRTQIAGETLEEMIGWLKRGGQIGIFDAVNHTRSRRQFVLDKLLSAGIDKNRIIFVESICNDARIIESNIKETKTRSPDYLGVDPDEAVKDFLKRISHYEANYEPIDEPSSKGPEDHLAFIKLINVGKKIILNRIRGYLPGRITNLLLNMHIQPRTIYITRHGESEYNVSGRIGGDSSLSSRGREYAHSLAAHMKASLPAGSPLTIWTSTLKRSIETAEHMKGYPIIAWKALDEIESGMMDGMTYEEIAEKYPTEFAARKRDKLRYRYPRGESYEDLILRLETVIIELERQRTPILIITHQAVTRALLAYLLEKPPHSCPDMEVPLHHCIQITPRAYGSEERRVALAPFSEAGADRN